MKLKAKRKNAVIDLETVGYNKKTFKFVYSVLKLFGFEIECDWSE